MNKKISKREFEFNNFRNIGVDSVEKLLLNTNWDSDNNKYQGNLLILIGPNNSGKSNILDALKIFSKRNLSERDKTNLNFDKEYQNPILKLISKNNNLYEEIILEKNEYSFLSNDEELKLKKALDTIENIYKKNENTPNSDLFIQLINKKDEIKNINDLEKILNQHHNGYSYTTKFDYFFNFINSYIDPKNEIEIILWLRNKLNQSQWNINVHEYTNNLIRSEDLSENINRIKQNYFFENLFKIIEYDTNTLLTTYQKYNAQKNRGFLNKTKNEINKKLKKVSIDFNKIYQFGDETYKFEIELESEKIELVIYKNNDPITLDYQSTGFKYFFDIYFNLISNNSLNNGDILIMDEPGTNIHPSGQKEFRTFLKDFAIKSNILIIIATHSPFLIDLDNLDEIRIVNSINNKIKIYNKFHSIEEDEEDVLFKIKNSLTVHNNVLFDPDMRVYFVEGITDYCYLTAFKKILKKNIKDIENIIFLPINGLGKTKEDKQETIKKIIKIRKNKSKIIVDNDRAGLEFMELNNSKDSCLEIICLSHISNHFKTIESLFNDEEKNKWGINHKEKSFENSVNFKLNIDNLDISKETIENFKKIFEHLLNGW